MKVCCGNRTATTAHGLRKEYPITDHLGSIRLVLTPDERQSIVSRSDFEPFGAPLANGRERLSFIGKEQDNESSLGDFGVRKYDPTLGRFMSVDALSDLMPGSSPFHYCFNNPLILRDPSGLVPGDIGSDGIPRFTTGEVVVYGERDNGSEDVIRDRKLEWMAKRAVAAAADRAAKASQIESGVKIEVQSGNIGELLNIGSTMWGLAEVIGHHLRKNGGVKYISSYMGISSSRVRSALEGTSAAFGTLGRRIGTAGYVLSAAGIFSKYLKGQVIKTSESVTFGINTALVAATYLAAGTAAAPLIGGAALLYGTAELGCYLSTGKTIEEQLLDP